MNTEQQTKYKEAQQFLNSIPYINSGGCLVSAYAMWHFCKKHKIKKPKVVSVTSNTYKYETNKMFVSGKSNHATSSAHFCWTFGKGYEDSRGKYLTKQTYRVIITHKTLPKFYKSAMKCADWNHSFNRRHIKKIEKGLGLPQGSLKIY